MSRAPARSGSPLRAAALATLLASAGLTAQEAPAPVTPADSSRMVEEMRERQRDFELFRQSRIPVDPERGAQTCDEQIGRICIWFGGEGEADYPPEPDETTDARASLIGRLIQTAERIRDPWVTGQLVHYLVEHGDLVNAERVATRCPTDEAWWCSALLGYVHHVDEDFLAAEVAFQDALDAMPEDELERWLTPRFVLTPEAVESFEDADLDEKNRRWALLWRLSDPLFMVEGNDRLTEHFARLVVARNQEHAENPMGMFWEEDLEATLIRYGRNVAWSRTHNPGRMFGGGGLMDTRRMTGHHHPMSRGYLFPEAFLASPSDVPPESWITAPRASRTWYAPPYAPDFRALETQVGRFRRADDMLVVGAYRPAPVSERETVEGLIRGADPDLDARGPIEAALVLLPVDGGEAVETRSGDPAGVFSLRAPSGRYVGSVEVLDAEGRRAWRARQGVRQDPLVPGLVALSDLMILEEGAPEPTSLEEAIPHVRAGVRVRDEERFAVVWEVYGLRVEETVRATLGFTRGRPGFLARVGEMAGVLEPDRPVEITFDETATDVAQAHFRSVSLQLPDLEPGEYTLHLRLEIAGREPVTASRPIYVVEG